MPIIGGITFDPTIYLYYYGQENEANYFQSFGKTDYFYGGNSFDQFFGDGSSDTMFGGNGNDLLSGNGGADYLYGGNDMDWLIGGDGNDQLFGGSGEDRLNGGAGADSLYGGSGNDFVQYTDSTSGVQVNLGTGFVTGGHATGDTLNSIESVEGSLYDDLLIGGNQSNVIRGIGGSDSIDGRGGDDFISGGRNGAGIAGDRMSGGSGADTFYFSVGDSGGSNTKDIIDDFSTLEDNLLFETYGTSIQVLGSASGFSGIGTQAYYEQYFDPNLGSMATEVHVRVDPFNLGINLSYLDVILVGAHTLDSTDILSV